MEEPKRLRRVQQRGLLQVFVRAFVHSVPYSEIIDQSRIVYDVDNEQSQFGSTSNTFDANGNLTSSSGPGGSTTYAWDSRNRLASITTSGGQTTRFIYDFAGNLIQQMDTGSSLNLTQTFVLDNLTNVAFVSRSDGDQYSLVTGQSIDDHVAAVHASGQLEYGDCNYVPGIIYLYGSHIGGWFHNADQ